MNIFSLLFIFIAHVSSFSAIRTYSVVWRNDQNKVVKHVTYDKNSVFTKRFPGEAEELNKLPNGWYYKAYPIDKLHKILVKQTMKIHDYEDY